MSEFINIGLDFGTHQTKVCIEDSSDPRNITYTFLKFFEGTEDETYFLPSIVQINEDHTLTYGKFDIGKIKCENKARTITSKPVLILPEKPEKDKYPPKPKEGKIMTFEEFKFKQESKKSSEDSSLRKKLSTKNLKKMLTELARPGHALQKLREEYDAYKKKANKDLQKDYKLRLKSWMNECDIIDKRYQRDCQLWEEACQSVREKYNAELKEWYTLSSVQYENLYRYFKIASFSKSYSWELNIDSMSLSIWYLTYVLFQIYKVVDSDSTVQMGIPQSISDTSHSRWQMRNAEVIFYTAYRLYKSFPTEEAFLNAKLEDLKEFVKQTYTEPDYDTEPGLLVLPEAFASLITLTKEGKISRGLNLLMDIGGGSTDISLFNVINQRGEYLPNISHILSVHKGLNHLFRLYAEHHENLTIEEAREIFEENPDSFDEHIFEFRKEIAKDIQSKIYFPLIEAAAKSGITTTQVKEALYSRPVIYTGGGGVYDAFIDTMHVFTDPMSMSKDFVAIKNITNKDLTDSELSILSVAYGLAVPQMREPQMTPLNKLFEHIQMESSNSGNYEHGITDIE